MTAMDKDTAPAPASNEESDHARLRRLFDAVLTSLLHECSQPAVKASMLEVARLFLRQNNITANRPRDLRDGLRALKDMPFEV